MRKIGRGITERSKPDLVPVTPDNMLALLRSIGKAATQPWGGYADVIAFARRRLQEIKAEAPSINDDLDGYNSFFVERVSEGWYVESVDIEAKVAEFAIQQGRPWEAFACGMRIGELLTERRIEFAWGPAALTGQSQRRFLDEAREITNRSRHDVREAEWRRWNEKAAQIWGQRPALSKTAVARKVIHGLGLSDSVRTVRDRLKKVGEAG